MSKFRRSKKEAAQIPLKAVEWAVYHLDKFARSKEHEDIDSKVSASRACCGSRAPLIASSTSFKCDNPYVNVCVLEQRLDDISVEPAAAVVLSDCSVSSCHIAQ